MQENKKSLVIPDQSVTWDNFVSEVMSMTVFVSDQKVTVLK